MKKDKDLQKRILEEFEKPDMSFEDWAKKHNIDLHSEQSTAQSSSAIVPESSCGQANSAVSVKKRVGIAVIVACAALAVALPIVFANLLSSKPKPEPGPPKVYGVSDVNTVTTSVEEMLAVENIYKLNASSILQIELTTKDVLIDDETQILSYTMNNCIASVERDGVVSGFSVTYKARLYENYEFLNFENYIALNETSINHNINISYRLVSDFRMEAYAKFKFGSYDYFLYAKGLEGVTTLTNDNFLILLDELLSS